MQTFLSLLNQNSSILISVSLLIIFSSFIRHCLIINNQNWIRTYSHTLSIYLLPIITFSVTSVISNNLALSLGLVGALSIVRFRNPVKSPFELTIYFLVISLGICSSVSIKWLIILGLSSIGLLVLFYLLNKLSLYVFKKPLFIASFSEGNSLNTLEIESLSEIVSLMNNSHIVSFQKYNDKFTYRLASSDKQALLKISSYYVNDEKINSISYSDF